MKILNKIINFFKPAEPITLTYRITIDLFDQIGYFTVDAVKRRDEKYFFELIKSNVAKITGNNNFSVIAMQDGWGADIYRCLDRTTGKVYLIC